MCHHGSQATKKSFVEKIIQLDRFMIPSRYRKRRALKFGKVEELESEPHRVETVSRSPKIACEKIKNCVESEG